MLKLKKQTKPQNWVFCKKYFKNPNMIKLGFNIYPLGGLRYACAKAIWLSLRPLILGMPQPLCFTL
jgi:hypothetical protein